MNISQNSFDAFINMLLTNRNNPLIEVIKEQCIKEIRVSFASITPAELTDLVDICTELAVSGGKRTADSLKPLYRSVNSYAQRVSATQAETEQLLSEAVNCYRGAMGLFRSTLEVLDEGFIDYHETNGAEPVPTMFSTLLDPNNPLAGVVVTERPPSSSQDSSQAEEFAAHQTSASFSDNVESLDDELESTYELLYDQINAQHRELYEEVENKLKTNFQNLFPNATEDVIVEIIDILDTFIAEPLPMMRETARQLIVVFNEEELWTEDTREETVVNLVEVASELIDDLHFKQGGLFKDRCVAQMRELSNNEPLVRLLTNQEQAAAIYTKSMQASFKGLFNILLFQILADAATSPGE